MELSQKNRFFLVVDNKGEIVKQEIKKEIRVVVIHNHSFVLHQNKKEFLLSEFNTGISICVSKDLNELEEKLKHILNNVSKIEFITKFIKFKKELEI